MPQRVIIIGASSGIGRELACKYAAQGDTVAITGRRQALLQEIAALFPSRMLYCCFDAAAPDNQLKLDEIIGRLGGLDLLIYNAGCGEVSVDLEDRIEKMTTRTNVNGFVEIVSYAFNYFIRQGKGQIAITSSVAALRGNGLAPAYSASKAYMSVYAEGLNIKAAKLGREVVVTDIRPGFVDTKLVEAVGKFWVAPVEKVARQMVGAIQRKKRVAYVTRRWWLVAQVLKIIPYSLYRRII